MPIVQKILIVSNIILLIVFAALIFKSKYESTPKELDHIEPPKVS